MRSASSAARGSRLQDGLSAVLGPVQARDPTGLVGMFPLGDTFRYYTVTGRVPEQDASSYRLAVTGLVERPGRHTLEELRAMPHALTLEQARRPDVLVALQMLGAPVTHDHGGPARLYVAPMYGYKSLKWLSGIELTRGGPRLLGGAGLRGRRLGGLLQRARR